MYYHQESPNYVGLKYDGDRVQYKYAVNPYCVEETYPEGRAAISSKTTVFVQSWSLIRNAAAITTVITNQDDECLYMCPVYNQDSKGFSPRAGSFFEERSGGGVNKKRSPLSMCRRGTRSPSPVWPSQSCMRRRAT